MTRSQFAIQALHDGYVIDDSYGSLPDERETLDMQVKHIMRDAQYIKDHGGTIITTYAMSHDDITRFRIAF